MKVQGVIFDWVGTTIDDGCLSPVAAFIEEFKSIKVDVSIDEVRKLTGKLKVDHKKVLFEMKSVIGRFFNI